MGGLQGLAIDVSNILHDSSAHGIPFSIRAAQRGKKTIAYIRHSTTAFARVDKC
jgi:hypothetical protein